MTLQGIQAMCLLTLAKSFCGASQDVTIHDTGSLIRTAMVMGLYRDPKHLHKMLIYEAEMRRRFWATILELNLQWSFGAGGSPLLSDTDYNTLPPHNLDDENLTDSPDNQDASEKPLSVLTQTSI
ncbi:Transcription factor lepE [Cladobotryum mycophilum]|uniref:Transcription factor lepE n=1 Tax=Cladobotryum mycophilum TaxID=491253 RepID=A0ABR0SQ57_9HYPO